MSCQWQKTTWFLRLYSYSAVLLHGSGLFPHSQAITKTSWDIWGFQQCFKHCILCVIKDHNKDYIFKLCYKTGFEKFHSPKEKFPKGYLYNWSNLYFYVPLGWSGERLKGDKEKKGSGNLLSLKFLGPKLVGIYLACLREVCQGVWGSLPYQVHLIQIFQYCFCFMFCFTGCEANGIFAPLPWLKPEPPALGGEVLSTGDHQGSP